MKRKYFAWSVMVAGFALVLMGCQGGKHSDVTQSKSARNIASDADDAAANDPTQDAFYYKKVQPILTNRCIACHGCYSSPCQLNFQSAEGVARGAHLPPDIYNPSRITPVEPTRLGVDAHTVAGWRKAPYSFFDVVENHTLLAMLGDEAQNSREVNAALLGLPRPEEEARVCSQSEAGVKNYFNRYPAGRMPYGLPSLSTEEHAVLAAWLNAKPAHVPDNAQNAYREIAADVHAALDADVTKWDAFFNEAGGGAGETARHQLVSRYIYEHLFLAHIYFDESPEFFYRLIRTKVACESGTAAENEISTRRPNDPPPVGISKVHYCLVPVNQVPVEKNHMPVRFNDQRLARFQSLFFNPNEHWAVNHPPALNLKTAANPFLAFQDIPAHARYQFLLDDAMYEVSTFIKGPVCHGNTAINSIQEQFYMLFLKPDSDPLARPSGDEKNPNSPFYTQAISTLEMPGQWADESAQPASSLWGAISQKIGVGASAITRAGVLGEVADKFEESRAHEFQRFLKRGLSLSDLWDGKDEPGLVNDNAFLTVFRHSESAYVMKGARGDLSKTVWVLDYSIFERLVYDLVVNYDVFDNIQLQLLTREYMGLIRIDAEVLFLNFLPKNVRSPLRKSWYRGGGIEVNLKRAAAFTNLAIQDDPEIKYSAAAHTNPNQAKREFVENVVAGPLNDVFVKHPDPINWKTFNVPKNANVAQDAIDTALRGIAAVHAQSAPFSLAFPDVSILQVVGADQSTARVFTIVRNKEVTTPVFLDSPSISAGENSLTVVKNLAGSMPNLFFRVQADQLPSWVQCIRALNPAASTKRSPAQLEADWSHLVACGGVPRNDTHFWGYYDEIQEFLHAKTGNKMGVLDLSRYGYPDTIELH